MAFTQAQLDAAKAADPDKFRKNMDAGIAAKSDTSGWDWRGISDKSVDRSYQENLGRSAGEEGSQYYYDQWMAGDLDPNNLDAILQSSTEGRGYDTENERWIDQQYRETFGRESDEEGRNFYTNLLRQGYSHEEVQRMMLEGAQGADYSHLNQENVTTGLVGSENVLNEGSSQGRSDIYGGANRSGQVLDEARGATRDYIDEGLTYFDPYTEAGADASRFLADLSGVNGPEAEEAAWADYEMSPKYQRILELSEQSLQNQAAATGGLGGGAYATALQENAMGIGAADREAYLDRLYGIGEQGLRGAEGSTGLIGQGIGQETMFGGKEADISYMAGRDAAQLQRDYDEQMGRQRYDFGQGQQERQDAYYSALADLSQEDQQAIEDLITGGTAGLGGIASNFSEMSTEDWQAFTELAMELGMTESDLMANIILSRGEKSRSSSGSAEFSIL